MRRREFIAGLGGAAAWPLVARGQQPMPMIGILSGGSPETFAPLEAPFREGLAEVGFVEGKNLAFAYRWARGQFERLPTLAVDVVNDGPAVIATNTLPAALAAKTAPRPSARQSRKRRILSPFGTRGRLVAARCGSIQRSGRLLRPSYRGCRSLIPRAVSLARSICARSIGTRAARSQGSSRHCPVGGARGWKC